MHKFFYSDHFDIPLPEKHRFPNKKYSELRRRLLAEGILNEQQLNSSPLAETEDLKLSHSDRYVEGFYNGSLPEKEMKRIGFPWSEHLVTRSRATVGGAIAASLQALKTGISGQLAGGTHHAHFDYGSGYCIFNDFAVVSKKLTSEGVVKKIAIVDLDVHQGDGNASILKSDKNIFVFSMHGAKNFPFRKFDSDLDIPLPDGCGDKLYLDSLQQGLSEVLSFGPELILYQAGVDILEQDRLGRMNISLDGLLKRDLMVFELFKNQKVPVSMAIGGGYSDPIRHSVDGYVQTYSAAKTVYGF